jgi:hypothetical protein
MMRIGANNVGGTSPMSQGSTTLTMTKWRLAQDEEHGKCYLARNSVETFPTASRLWGTFAIFTTD